MTTGCAKISPKALGLAFGILWALAMLILAWLDAWLGYGHAFVQGMASVYIGYGPSVLGGVIGLIWGFIDFFIFGWLVAWLYNRFAA